MRAGQYVWRRAISRSIMLLHDHVLLDPPPELVRLGRVEVDVLLQLEAELAAEHPGVVEVAAQEHLVHAPQVLLVEEILVPQQLAIGVDLGALQLDGGDERFVGHGRASLAA